MGTQENSRDIFDNIELMLSILPQSPHPTSKVAARLVGTNFALQRTNFWPEPIARHFSPEQRIGNASGTIHAETAVILSALNAGYACAGASMFLSDPPCPNCVKNMICAGISEIYIDHHGFEKDFAQRRFQYFLDLSLPLAARAGVNVYKADSQERICALLQPADSSFGSHITRSTARYDQLSPDCKALTAQYAPYPWAGAQMGDVFLSACAAPSLGVTEDEVQQKHTKYSLMLQPLTRILMIAARGGQRLYPHSFVLSRIPTAREMVDFVGAGYDSFRVISPEDARDSESRQALNLLTRHKIIDYKISEL